MSEQNLLFKSSSPFPFHLHLLASAKVMTDKNRTTPVDSLHQTTVLSVHCIYCNLQVLQSMNLMNLQTGLTPFYIWVHAIFDSWVHCHVLQKLQMAKEWSYKLNAIFCKLPQFWADVIWVGVGGDYGSPLHNSMFRGSYDKMKFVNVSFTGSLCIMQCCNPTVTLYECAE